MQYVNLGKTELRYPVSALAACPSARSGVDVTQALCNIADHWRNQDAAPRRSDCRARYCAVARRDGLPGSSLPVTSRAWNLTA